MLLQPSLAVVLDALAPALKICNDGMMLYAVLLTCHSVTVHIPIFTEESENVWQTYEIASSFKFVPPFSVYMYASLHNEADW